LPILSPKRGKIYVYLPKLTMASKVPHNTARRSVALYLADQAAQRLRLPKSEPLRQSRQAVECADFAGLRCGGWRRRARGFSLTPVDPDV
jgi:hypothetical protein